MFRNLEKHQDPVIKTADKSAPAECQCACQEETEKGSVEKPGPNQTYSGLRIHYDINK